MEISWEEFLAFQAKAKMSLEASWPFDVSEIRQEFSDIDTDGSGTISKVPFIYYVSKCRGGALCFEWGFTRTFPGNQDVAVT